MKISEFKNWQSIKKMIPSRLFDFMYYCYLQFRSYKFKGVNIYCPICETTHSSFISNCCPKCDSSIRHRTVWLFLRRKTNFFKNNLKFLHFAPEYCFTQKFKQLKNLDYLNADFNSPRAMEKIDMMNIPYPDNHFDVSLSIDVLDDVPNDFKAISELHRIQKPDGWSIHLVPIVDNKKITLEKPEITKCPKKRLKYYGGYANFRRYGKDYKDRLMLQGFDVKTFKTSDFCDINEIKKMGLQKHFSIYFLKKSDNLDYVNIVN